MADGNSKSSALWQIITSVIVALLVGGTAPWWWQEFFARQDGVSTKRTDSNALDDNEDIPSLEPIELERTEEEQPEELSPQQTSIALAYRGDYYGCSLPIAVSIGEQTFYLQGGNVILIDGVPVGQQNYRIAGKINCNVAGSCQVNGWRTIEVIPSNTYYVGWNSTALGQCSAFIRQ